MNRTSTFWRIYLHGLVLLLLVAVAVAAVGWAMGRPGPKRGAPERMARWIAAEHAPLLDDPAALQAQLAETSETLGLNAAIYDLEGRRLAAAGDRPPGPPPPGPPPGRRPQFNRSAGVVVAPLGDPPQAVLVGSLPHWQPGLARPAAVLAAVLIALALGSIPLARSVAAPIERLTGTVRRFGGGDLAARTGGMPARGEVGELARAFDDMAERIERLVRGEKELLANVSHELRTPLARIRVALELAEEGDRSGQRWLREIETDLAELESMIDDVLTAARLDLAASAGTGGTPPVRLGAVEVADLVEGAAARFAAIHPDRPLELQLEGTLPQLQVDGVLLRRALANLLDNAAKYSEAPVLLRGRAVGRSVVLEVIDRGIGIEPADLPRLFTPFFRTDRSRARGTGGVGLGLVLARRIVEAHGGRLEVESRPGEGSTFRTVLPA